MTTSNDLPLNINAKISLFAALLEQAQRERYAKDYPRTASDAQDLIDRACQVTVKSGKKYTKVDVGTSGKYMVEMETGTIFGIKAYGVIHRGHQYGNLDTIHEWDWSGYTAVLLRKTPYTPAEQAKVNAWVHSAAVASETLGDDELERFAEEL